MSLRIAPRSVRGKAVLGSGVAIAVFGIAIGLASYVFVSQAATASTTAIVDAQVSDIGDQLAEQTGSDIDAIDLESPEPGIVTYVQIAASDGAIRQASSTVAPGDRICPEPVPAAGTSQHVTTTIAGATGGFLVRAERVPTAGGPLIVCAATSDDPIQRAQRTVALGLLIGLPLLVLGVCIVVWLAVGRALRAVDDMTSQADEMQSTADGELRVRETHDEVERLGRTLNAMLARLHHQTNATRQFVADAGHELRNPLSTLRVTLEFGEDADEPALRASVRDALTDLDRLEQLVQDLLVLARTDAMEEPVAVEDVHLDELVDAVVQDAQRSHPDLLVEARTVPARLRGNAAALRSLLTNLTDNAMRHAASTVSVGLASDGAVATLRVDDDGHGLDPADCTRVFDRFVRLDEARDRDEGGSGLGLAIVSAVAEAHGGRAHAEPGPGGHFVVTLPVARD